MRITTKKLRHYLFVLISFCAVADLQASGFAVNLYGANNLASGLANTSEANRPSAVFLNPSAMSRLEGRGLSVGFHGIAPKVKFTNDGSNTGTSLMNVPLSDNSDAGVSYFVPNLYYVHPMNEHVTLGLAINAPFGQQTDYGERWAGRYEATKSKLSVININPALSWAMNKNISLGAGVNVQTIDGELGNHLDSFGLCAKVAAKAGELAANIPGSCSTASIAGPGALAGDSKQELSGSSTAMGYNFGFLYTLNQQTRMGMAYRSQVKHDFDGDVDFTLHSDLATVSGTTLGAILPAAIASTFADQAATASIDLPATFSTSIYHDVSDRLAVMADITWTEWSVYDELRIKMAKIADDNVTTNNWNNTMRYAVGLKYRTNDTFVWRLGYAVDETPIPDNQRRTARIPDADRTLLSAGVSMPVNDNATIDLGYMHVFIDNPMINAVNENTGAKLIGSYDSSVDIVSAQYTWEF